MRFFWEHVSKYIFFIDAFPLREHDRSDVPWKYHLKAFPNLEKSYKFKR